MLLIITSISLKRRVSYYPALLFSKVSGRYSGKNHSNRIGTAKADMKPASPYILVKTTSNTIVVIAMPTDNPTLANSFSLRRAPQFGQLTDLPKPRTKSFMPVKLLFWHCGHFRFPIIGFSLKYP